MISETLSGKGLRTWKAWECEPGSGRKSRRPTRVRALTSAPPAVLAKEKGFPRIGQRMEKIDFFD